MDNRICPSLFTHNTRPIIHSTKRECARSPVICAPGEREHNQWYNHFDVRHSPLFRGRAWISPHFMDISSSRGYWSRYSVCRHRVKACTSAEWEIMTRRSYDSLTMYTMEICTCIRMRSHAYTGNHAIPVLYPPVLLYWLDTGARRDFVRMMFLRQE